MWLDCMKSYPNYIPGIFPYPNHPDPTRRDHLWRLNRAHLQVLESFGLLAVGPVASSYWGFPYSHGGSPIGGWFIIKIGNHTKKRWFGGIHILDYFRKPAFTADRAEHLQIYDIWSDPFERLSYLGRFNHFPDAPWCWNMNPYIYPKNQPVL